MQEEEKTDIAEGIIKRLKIYLRVMQSLTVAMIVCVAALVIFVAAASLSGLRESSEASFLLGVIITGGFAVLCVTGVLVTALIAFITLKRLKKLVPQGEAADPADGGDGGSQVNTESQVNNIKNVDAANAQTGAEESKGAAAEDKNDGGESGGNG